MGTRSGNLSRGLRLMYIGAAVSLVSTLGMLVPVLESLFFLAGMGASVLSIVGLAQIRKEHADYKKALIVLAVGAVCGLFIRGHGDLSSLMGTIKAMAELLGFYFVIRATNVLLRERGFMEQAEKGDKAWKWALLRVFAAFALAMVTTLLMLIHEGLAFVGVICSLFMLGLSVYALFLYMGYLKESSKVL